MIQHLVSAGTKSMPRPRVSITSLLVFIFLGSYYPSFAQNSASQQNTRDTSSTGTRRLPQPSDLANENLNHLAAAARQIQEVLLKDTGLLVELKRLAIKEATDNRRIVEDSSLTGQAIFDRLEQDIKFGALATGLVQRYGYLLPSFNPDSELAKQRDLLLKERARHQLQVEAQEDAEIDAAAKKQADLEVADNCENGQQEDCMESSAPRRTRRGTRWPNGNQREPADQGGPSVPQQTPSPNPSSPILRAGGGASDLGTGGGPENGMGSQQLSSMRSDRGGQDVGSGDEGGVADNRTSRIERMMAAAQRLGG